MTGGTGSGHLSSSEQLDPNSLQWSFPGPPLPEASYGHCVVSINDTTILIIGGGISEDGTDKTFFFHHDGTVMVRCIVRKTIKKEFSRRTNQLVLSNPNFR